jgi:hypothetical protein
MMTLLNISCLCNFQLKNLLKSYIRTYDSYCPVSNAFDAFDVKDFPPSKALRTGPFQSEVHTVGSFTVYELPQVTSTGYKAVL